MTSTTQRARDRILTTAKRLFAERGVDGVSLREIVREAEIKHATAVQYHFGDREGLIRDILSTHRTRVAIRREAMLDSYEANPDTISIRDISAILVRPIARELETVEGRHFLQIYAQLMQRPQEWFGEIDPGFVRWRREAEQFLPPGAAALHTRYSATTFAHTELARRAREKNRGDDRLFVSRIIDVVTSILQTPLSEETERLYNARSQSEYRAGSA